MSVRKGGSNQEADALRWKSQQIGYREGDGFPTRKGKILRLGSSISKGTSAKSNQQNKHICWAKQLNSYNTKYKAVKDSGFQMEENSGKKDCGCYRHLKAYHEKSSIELCGRERSHTQGWEWSVLMELGLIALNDDSCHCLFSGTIELSGLRTQMYLANSARFINWLLLPCGLTSLTHSHKKPQWKTAPEGL